MNKDEVLQSIEKIENNTYKEVLTLRCIKGYSWQKISFIMNYSKRQVERIYKKALKEIDK